jgi:hypothetical protein
MSEIGVRQMLEWIIEVDGQGEVCGWEIDSVGLSKSVEAGVIVILISFCSIW